MSDFKIPIILSDDEKYHRPCENNEQIHGKYIPISKKAGNALKVINGRLYAKACGDNSGTGGGGTP